MKHFFYILLIFSFPLFTKAQSNYKPGYIVNTKGDTVTGYINYREWLLNPQKIEFKPEISSDAIEYSTENASAFGINKAEYYERFNVSVSQDVTGDDKGFGPDTSRLNQTVFLKLLSDGDKLNLYQYADALKIRYYIKETGGTKPRELVYRSYRDINSKVIISTFFRAQLNQVAVKHNINSEAIKKRISIARYSATDLTKVTQLINGTSINEHSGSNFGVRFFGGLSVNYTKLKVKGYRYFDSERANITSTPFPRLQAGLDVFANRHIKRFVFRTELSFTASHYKMSVPIERLSNVNGEGRMEFTQKAFVITPQFQYAVYNTNNFKVYLTAGMTFNIFAYGKHIYKEIYNDAYYNAEYPNDVSFVKTGIANIGSINISFKKFEVFASVTPRMNNTDFLGYNFSTRVYQLGFNWYLSK